MQLRERPPCRDAGFSLLDTLMAVSLAITLAGIALPVLQAGLDDQRAFGAARYLAHRCALARMEAVKRASNVALRFDELDGEHRFATYVDGNGNGVRALDIQRGIDVMLSGPERPGEKFAGVRFGVASSVPNIDGRGSLDANSDPVRFGSARMVSFSATGSATAGTVYLHSRRGRQYAVRVLGVTGRTRVLEYDPEGRTWRPR